jgi:Fur family transcriptional regulator, zinc uptake regulator
MASQTPPSPHTPPSGLSPEALAAGLARAEAAALAVGETLTPLRRRVYELLLHAPGPVKAYDLLAQVRPDQGPAKPPTIYRTLDFLIRAGLVHKLERDNAFVACQMGADHAAQVFLICKTCGKAQEVEAGHAIHDIGEAAGRLGFVLADTVLEAYGLCAACARAA